MSYSCIQTHKHMPYLSTLLVCVDALNQIPIKIRGWKFFLFMGRSTCAPASTPVISGHRDVLCQNQNSVSEQRVDVNVCQLDKQVQFVVLVKTTTKI